MATAVAEFLTPEAVTRTHQAAHQTIGALLARGQAGGSFRTDLPAAWLVTACIALIHACSDGVRAGHRGARTWHWVTSGEQLGAGLDAQAAGG